MLVQSGGGKVYAVIANTDQYELSVMPTMQIISTSVFLLLRLRFKSLQTDYFDPMLVPKKVLVSGIERSKNTLRGHYTLNSGFTVEKVGAGFPTIMAQKVIAGAPEAFLPYGEGPNGEKPTEVCALYAEHMREDFAQDFAQLVESAVSPIFPAKDFSDVPELLTPFDMQLYMETASDKGPASPFAVHDGGKAAQDGPNVTKFPFGTPDTEEAPDASPAAPETTGVDEPATADIFEGPEHEPETTN